MSAPRFQNVDPLAEKYHSTSPYAYVMNNPLKYIDPTGMWIYLYYGGSFYRYDDGKYTNEYTAEEGRFLAGVTSGLKDLSSKSSTGNWISNYFGNDEKNINIMSLSKDGANERDMEYGNAYDYHNNIIYLKDDMSGTSIPTERGFQDSPFWLDIGHGIDQDIRGATTMGQPWNMILSNEYITDSEKVATHYENMMSSEALLPLRTHYAT